MDRAVQVAAASLVSEKLLKAEVAEGAVKEAIKFIARDGRDAR